MLPFLKLVADDLYTKKGGDFTHTTIIFPNKRASLFFNQHLRENATGHALITPEYTTISDVFETLSDMVTGDKITLTLQLLDTYNRIMRPAQSADQLYPMMEIMLSDFDDIDNNMVDTRKLFVNAINLKEMTDFSFLNDDQRRAIRHLFSHLSPGTNADNLLKARFTNLWLHMQEIYDTFRSSLLQDTGGSGLPAVYGGMMKRLVAETLLRNQPDTAARLTSSTYVMVGFNVLNQTEKVLFRFLKEHRDAKFYWDYDETYTKPTKPQGGNPFEAGLFIRDNIRTFGSELDTPDACANMRRPKTITFAQSQTDDAQARYTRQWLAHQPTRWATSAIRPAHTAIVLCDESLLLPVLHSLGQPAWAGPINVTMGMPLSETPALSLAQVLLDLQIRGAASTTTWKRPQAEAVLKHPLIRLAANGGAEEALRQITHDNSPFPTTATLARGAFLERVFTPHHTQTALLQWLASLTSLIATTQPQPDGGTERAARGVRACPDTPESRGRNAKRLRPAHGLAGGAWAPAWAGVFILHTLVNRLTLIWERSPLTPSTATLARLLIQLARRSSIPFHGEPATGMQILGLLETRNLDFSNLLVLSVSEGNLPKSDHSPSLIPYNLRAAYGMTTLERNVALYAYYYYRLIQRAEHVTLAYNANHDGRGGEMSRFMLQTLIEKDRLLHPNTQIHNIKLTPALPSPLRPQPNGPAHAPGDFRPPSRMGQPTRWATSAVRMEISGSAWVPAWAPRTGSLAIPKSPEVIARMRTRFSIHTSPLRPPSRMGQPTRWATSAVRMEISGGAWAPAWAGGGRVSPRAGSLAPSAICAHITCPLSFFFRYVAGLKPPHNPDNELDPSTFGTIFHATMQTLYTPLQGQPLTTSLLHNISQDDTLIRNALDNAIAQRVGWPDGNIAQRMGWHTLVRKQLQADSDTVRTLHDQGASLRIVSQEERHSIPLHIPLADGTSAQLQLAGTIDRIDRIDTPHGHRYRLVDYKTSRKPTTHGAWDTLFDSTKSAAHKHIVQVLCYAYILSREPGPYSQAPIQPALMYPASPPHTHGKIRLDGEEVTDFRTQCQERYEKQLIHTIQEILNPSGTFRQSESENACAHCDFLDICRKRKPEQHH